MVRSAGPDTGGDQPSLGDLVALAAKDVSQLIRYEIDLAVGELRADLKRAALAGALFGFSAFIGCLVLVLLSFALAYGLRAAGIPGAGGMYVAFVYAAIICVLLAAVAVVLAIFGLKRFSKMSKTRKTVAEDIDLLRRRDTTLDGSSAVTASTAASATPNGTGPASTRAASTSTASTSTASTSTASTSTARPTVTGGAATGIPGSSLPR